MQTNAKVKFNSLLYFEVMEKMEKHLQMKMAKEDIHALLDVDTVSFSLHDMSSGFVVAV